MYADSLRKHIQLVHLVSESTGAINSAGVTLMRSLERATRRKRSRVQDGTQYGTTPTPASIILHSIPPYGHRCGNHPRRRSDYRDRRRPQRCARVSVAPHGGGASLRHSPPRAVTRSVCFACGTSRDRAGTSFTYASWEKMVAVDLTALNRTGAPPLASLLAGSSAFERLRTQQIANSRAKARERRGWLSPCHTEGDYFRHRVTAQAMWSIFTPTYTCPWTLEKDPSVIRKHDGGKWHCGLRELGMHTRKSSQAWLWRMLGFAHRTCVAYSFGSYNQFDFEKSIRRAVPSCEIHTFDPTVTPRHDPHVVDAFHTIGLGAHDRYVPGLGEVRSLPGIMRSLGHAAVDILKIGAHGTVMLTELPLVTMQSSHSLTS